MRETVRRRRSRLLEGVVAVLVVAVGATWCTVAPSQAATAPLLPFADTGDLYFVDDVSDSILKATPSGDVSVVVANATLKALIPNTTQVEFQEPVIAFAADGTMFFTVRYQYGTGDRYTLVKKPLGGAPVILTRAEAVDTATGYRGGRPATFALAPDGTIYLVDELAVEVLKVDSTTGAVTPWVDQAALAAAVGVTGVSLDANPVLDEAGYLHLPREHSPSSIWRISPSGAVTVIPDVVDEIQLVSVTGATGGTFRLVFGGAQTASLAPTATAAEVESALDALATLDDVRVTRGAGTATDPWVVEFGGAQSDQNVSGLGVVDALAPDTATVNVEQRVNGGDLGDVDTYITRDQAGNLTLIDDANNWVFTRTPAGRVTTLLSEAQLVRTAGGTVSLEGGVAWDDRGILYLADAGTDRILRFFPDGRSEVFIGRGEVRAATGLTSSAVDGGIAFAPGTGGGSEPTTTTAAPTTTTTSSTTTSSSTTTTVAKTTTTTSSSTTTTVRSTTTTTAPKATTTTAPTTTTSAPTTTTTAEPTTTTTTPPPGPGPVAEDGYALVTADGTVTTFGAASHHGDLAGQRLNQPVIGLTMTPTGEGYWLVARDGGIFTFGDAAFHGSMGGTRLNAPVLGMEATPTGDGYWLFGADGGIFTFGDAAFHGSTGGLRLNAPMIGMEATPGGDGYWLVAQDGGIFTFGAAPFHGSTGDLRLNQPVFDMASTADGGAYWLVARDGGIFTFPADATFYGSAVGQARGAVIGMRTTASGLGYWIVDATGHVATFGDAPFLGEIEDATSTVVGFGVA